MQAFVLVKMHYSDSESDNESATNPNNELQFISEQVAAAPVILEKSQVPNLKRKKDEAIENLIKKYEATFGKPLDTKGLLKKINNMKTRLNRKTDLKRTGNKAIKLLDWEKSMLKAMEGDTNPTIGKIRGGMQIGIQEGDSSQKRRNEPILPRSESEATHEQSCSSLTDVQPLPPKKKLATEKYETDETRKMTTKELQRLVLLQQYKTSVVQQQYYEKKLEMMQQPEKSTPKTVSDGNQTYFML